jgi:hypothetical protein
MIENPLHGKTDVGLPLQPWEENPFPPTVIPICRMGDPLEPQSRRTTFVPVSFCKATSDEALELSRSVRKPVQEVFDECLAQVLPEPVRTGLQSAVKENTPSYLIGTALV